MLNLDWKIDTLEMNTVMISITRLGCFRPHMLRMEKAWFQLFNPRPSYGQMNGETRLVHFVM